MKKLFDSLFAKVATLLKVNLLGVAYNAVGIGLSSNMDENGESNFLEKIFPKYNGNDSPVVFDVGGNIGEFSERVLRFFPKATVHLFEPNPITFETLVSKFQNETRIILNNRGLSSSNERSKIFFYSTDKSTGHATQYKDVFNLYKDSDVDSVDIDLVTLDEYVKEKRIEAIDLLKIDTEGNEFNVLKGGTNTLTNGLVKVIQFEFNFMNIISKVFLRDFYTVLEGYSFFRIKPKGLLPLGPYSYKNEVFIIQNIVAFYDKNSK